MATAVLEIQCAALSARESIKDLRNMAASLGCVNQAKAAEHAMEMVGTIEKVLAIVAEDGKFAVLSPTPPAA